jgi:hypothetical protein
LSSRFAQVATCLRSNLDAAQSFLMLEYMRAEHDFIDPGALDKGTNTFLNLLRIADDCFAQGMRRAA